MRFAHTAGVVMAAALLSACSDTSPVAPKDSSSLYDMSSVTVSRGNGTVPPHGAGMRATGVAPRYVCYQTPEGGYCEPISRPLADFDYGPDYYGSNNGTTKQVHIAAWSDNYAHIDNMILTVHFKSVGGQGSQGCNATPQQFDQETVSGFGTPWGNHYSIWAERNLSYPSSETWVWGVSGDHTFDASAGYSVDGYANVGTFYSSGKLCT